MPIVVSEDLVLWAARFSSALKHSAVTGLFQFQELELSLFPPSFCSESMAKLENITTKARRRYPVITITILWVEFFSKSSAFKILFFCFYIFKNEDKTT